MPFQTCRILYPLLWQLARQAPDRGVSYLHGEWALLAGHPLCTKTEPTSVEGETLIVTVCSEAWKRALEKMTSVLLERIHDLCGQNSFRRLEFRIGPVKAAAGRPSAKKRPESFPDPVPVHPVERLGEEIKDRELRDLFVSVAAKNLMLRSR
jgi:hypothetical protein